MTISFIVQMGHERDINDTDSGTTAIWSPSRRGRWLQIGVLLWIEHWVGIRRPGFEALPLIGW